MGTTTSKIKTAVSYIPAPFKTNLAVEGVKKVNENAGNFLGVMFDIILAEPGNPALDNPFFGQNGHEGPSPKTNDYLSLVKSLRMGGSLVTGLADVGGLASAAQTGATSVTYCKLYALFMQMIPKSRKAKSAVYASWFSYEVAQKAVPAGSLETRLTAIMRQKFYGAASSGVKTGITFGTGGWTGYFVNSAAASVAPFLDSWLGQDTQTLAQGLHWFAFLELVVGRGVGKGPAMRILEVIWSELSLGRAFLPAMADIVREPRGWLVVADLLA